MTPAELKAMHDRMTTGEWCVDAHHINGPNGQLGWLYADTREQVLAKVVPNALGIVALHNHFAALMERYEAMRVALEGLRYSGIGEENRFCDHPTDPCERCDAAAAALALADQPLETAS